VYSFGGSSGHLSLNIVSGEVSTFSGTLGSAFPNFALSKIGGGTQILSGANTYTGGTTVEGGTLVAANTTGSAFGSGGVVVRNGGTLGGSGRFTGALIIADGGTVAPGNSPGTLNSGDTTFAAGGSYVWEVNDATGVAGINWDLLDVTGTLTIDATAGSPFTIIVTSLDGSDQAGELANFDDQLDYSFLLLSTTGGIELGAGATLESSFAIDTSAFTNTFEGNWSVALDGNDLFLTYVVPEPRFFAVLLGCIALGSALLRRRPR
jgi:autotransporter-associated beta strand protein